METEMIYDKATGQPLGEVLTLARLTSAEARRKPVHNYVLDPNSNDAHKRAYRIGHDRLGDVYRVYRATVRHRPGQGYAERQADKELMAAAQ